MVFSLLWQCLRGPRLFRMHQEGLSSDQAGYEFHILERLPDSLLSALRMCAGVMKWTVPVWVPLAKRRGLFSQQGLLLAANFSTGVLLFCLIALSLRSVGRALNPAYREFLRTLRRAQQAFTTENREALARYDFEFGAWPVTYDVRESRRSVPATVQVASRASSNLIFDGLGWLLAHTLGIRMVYPGCTGMLGALVRPALVKGRAELRLEYPQLQRHKLVTRHGHVVEAFVVDRRGDMDQPRAATLLVCCEGNAGFPEIGCPLIALKAGYSVLGWSHPGFAGSTGVPYPDQEQAAIDAVMRFAQEHMAFEASQCGLLAWSIGGYTATWAAMNHPAVGFVVLDATFDDIEVLAQNAMPAFASSLVRHTIRRFIDLNNAEQLCKYAGPVKLVRRAMDEMISTSHVEGVNQLQTNRGNQLLLRLLTHRYPNLMGSADRVLAWLHCPDEAARRQLLERHAAPELGQRLLRSFLRQHVGATTAQLQFPVTLGAGLDEAQCTAVLLFLAAKIMVHQESAHCTPLKHELLSAPFHERDLLARDTEEEIAVVPTAGSSSGDSEDWERVDE